MDSHDQGGVMINTWYDIQIQYVLKKIEVRFDVHTQSNNPNEKSFGPNDSSMSLVLEAKDASFT